MSFGLATIPTAIDCLGKPVARVNDISRSSRPTEGETAQAPEEEREEKMRHEGGDDQFWADAQAQETPANDRKKHQEHDDPEQ